MSMAHQDANQSKTRLESLQKVQNDALRAIVGLTATCPRDFLHLEANVEPLKLRYAKTTSYSEREV